MASRLTEIIALGIEKTGNRDDAIAFVMDQMEHDDGFRAEMERRATEFLVAEISQEVIDDPRFDAADQEAIVREVSARFRRVCFRLVGPSG